MPTATSTLTKVSPTTSHFSLKGSITSGAKTTSLPSTTKSTLRTLYNRAARAFLLHDFPLTHSLIESAFSTLHSLGSFGDDRRKWDILRITLECTVYFSPPTSHDKLPGTLRDLHLQSPRSLLTSIYARSLALFSPSTERSNMTPACLPPSVLVTLIHSSLRLDCPDFGRAMIEDWLARRDLGPSTSYNQEMLDVYEKVLELYCLQILPKLQQWDYAAEFLEYEIELSPSSRDKLQTSLRSLRMEVISSRQSRPITKIPTSEEGLTPRSSSPAPSSSSSSSLSTTSTHTVVPSNHRSPQTNSGLTLPVFSNVSSASVTTETTITPHQSPHKPTLRSRAVEPLSLASSSSVSPSPRSTAQTAAVQSTKFSTYALLKATLAPYLTARNISTLFLLFVVFPLFSLALRARRRREESSTGISRHTNSVSIVRKRLQGFKVDNAFGTVWKEVVRVVCDTAKMAGSGLV